MAGKADITRIMPSVQNQKKSLCFKAALDLSHNAD